MKPTFGLIGRQTPPKALQIGFVEAAISRVIVLKSGTSAATLAKGSVLVRDDTGKFSALKAADLDTVVGAYPASPVAVLAETVEVPATGDAQAQGILRGEVAADLLLVGTTAWKDLTAANAVKVENLLAACGIVPGAVLR